MKSSKMNKMKKRLLALLLCMVMMMNGSVSALASEVTASDEVNAISQDAGIQTASLETVHEHTGECYSRSKVSDALICGKEVVEGHTHGDTCYEVTSSQEFSCTLEETPGHSHDEGCYTTVETKNCSLEEHTHGDGCYTTEFTCGTEEHSHGDECFTTETINVCGQEEKEAHTHGDGCYTTVENKTLICQLEEAEGHAHSDECYEWTEELICTIPAETPTVEPEIIICEVCGKEECECEAEIEICEVCGKETCECEAEEEAEPIALTTEVDGTTITLSGPAEAFTEGMVYSIEAAIVETEQEVEVIEEVLEEVAVEQEKVVKNYQAFDIKIIERDAEGNVTNDDFQPLNETPVMVTFSSKEVAESVENEETETSVLHVDTEKKEAEDMAAEVTEDKDVAIETTHFSIYVYVELEGKTGITLTIEHWIGNVTESVKTNTIILPDGFRGTIDELKTACLSEEALENYILESVYIEEDGDWKLLDDESIITLEKDAKLKLEYNGVESSLPFFNFTPKAESGEKEIYKDKTAEPLDENYVSDVTLQVGGVETGESVDIVFLLGGGMTANKKTVEAAINVFDKVMEQPETKVRIGIISLEKGQEIILDLNSDEAVLDPETYEKFIAEKFEYINTLPGGTTNLHSQLVEAKKMLDADTKVKASNKYMFVIATGRTYWFDDANGNQATVVMKTPRLNNGSSGKGAGTYYYYGNYPWQSLRGGHSSLYMVPDGNWDTYWNNVCEWVEADGNTYVYSPLFEKNDYSAYVNWYNQNKDDWRTLYNGGSGTRYGSLIINPVPSAENYITGAVAGITYASNPKHAMGYERAQYESAKAYVELVNAGYNCFSLCSETAYYQNNSPYITNRGYDGSSRIQLGHSFMDYLARLGGQKEAAKLFEFLYDENGNCTWEEVLREDFFEQIESEIIKSLSKGSRVEDYIGYNDGSDGREPYDFDFFVTTPDEDGNVKDFILNIGDNTYTAKVTEIKNGATASYSFNEGKHTVDYYYGDGKTEEHFVWNINEDVVGASAKLTYPVKLVDKSSEPGTHKAYTNRYAVLFPVNSEGEKGEPEYFPTPEVEYKVTRSLLINKVSSEDSTVGLAGAEFAVTKAGETKALTFVQRDANDDEDVNSNYYICDPEGTITTLVSGSNGKIMIEGLAGVKYQLREIKAPAGYSLLDEVYTIDLSLQDESKNPVTTVDGNDYNDEFVIMTKELVTLTIENLPLYELPSTGGYGSFLYTLSGAVLVLGSSLMKYKKKREEVLGSEE